MQKDVTLHSLEVQRGFGQHSDGARKPPLQGCGGTGKEATAHMLLGYAYFCTCTQRSQALGDT